MGRAMDKKDKGSKLVLNAPMDVLVTTRYAISLEMSRTTTGRSQFGIDVQSGTHRVHILVNTTAGASSDTWMLICAKSSLLKHSTCCAVLRFGDDVAGENAWISIYKISDDVAMWATPVDIADDTFQLFHKYICVCTESNLVEHITPADLHISVSVESRFSISFVIRDLKAGETSDALTVLARHQRESNGGSLLREVLPTLSSGLFDLFPFALIHCTTWSVTSQCCGLVTQARSVKKKNL